MVPISAYFHNLYVQTVQETLLLLEARNRLNEAVTLCRQALAVEPYSEKLYQHLMQDLLGLGRHREVITVFEEMSQLLLDNFGLMPSEELRALHREAVRTTNDRAVSLGTVR